MEGFETVLETTDRKERKYLVENEPLKDLRGSTEKRNWSIRLGDRGDVQQLKGGFADHLYLYLLYKCFFIHGHCAVVWQRERVEEI